MLQFLVLHQCLCSQASVIDFIFSIFNCLALLHFAHIQISPQRNLSSWTNFAETDDAYLEPWSSFPAALRDDVNDLWTFIGPISCLPNSALLKLDRAGSNPKLSPAAQWLHLHLELKWGLIEILWRMYCAQGIL